MKLSKWRILYRRKASRVYMMDDFDASYDFCTDESFTPTEALRVGMDEIGKNMHSFDRFEHRGNSEKLP